MSKLSGKTPYKKTQLKTLITFDKGNGIDFKLNAYTFYVKRHLLT